MNENKETHVILVERMSNEKREKDRRTKEGGERETEGETDEGKQSKEEMFALLTHSYR